MTTDMGGTQGKSARCPREEPAHRLFRAEFRSREPRHGNRGKKTTEIHAALASGGRIVKMGSVPSLDRFQAQAIWEMSVNSSGGIVGTSVPEPGTFAIAMLGISASLLVAQRRRAEYA